MDFLLLQKNLEPLEAADETCERLNNILTMLTASNLEMIIYDARHLKINSAESLEKCVDVIFESAINNESQSVYADLCSKLFLSSVPICKESLKMITFKEQVFEKSRREVLNFLERQTLSNSRREEKTDDEEICCLRKLRRPIALFSFIGELFLVNFLPSSFVQQCMNHLLDEAFCNESTLETFYAFAKIVGKKLEVSEKLDLSNTFRLLAARKVSVKLNPHTRFMIEELVEIRANRWEPANEIDWIMLYNLFLCDVEERLYVLELWYGK